MGYAMYEPISNKCAIFALALSATLASGAVVAQSGSGSGMGGGQQMMGQGHGMMGQGMGPGMMGQGMGPGMMGQGMMGPYVSGVLGLSEDQRKQMEEIQRENASEHWQMMQEMQQHRGNMMEAYDQDAPDPDAVGDAFSRMMETRRGMIEQQVRVQNRMREVLTEEQRKRLDEMRRFNWSE